MEEFLKLLNLRDILLHIANTVILLIAIRLLVYKPVRKFLNARTERVNAQLDDAAAKREQADAALAEAQAGQRAASEAAVKVQTEGALRAQEIGDQLIADAKEHAAEILRKASVEADAIRAAAQEEVQEQALTMAVQIAERMIGRELAVKDNETLAREFLTKVG